VFTHFCDEFNLTLVIMDSNSVSLCSFTSAYAEMEPGHRVSDFGRVGSGRVTGQCVRPGV